MRQNENENESADAVGWVVDLSLGYVGMVMASMNECVFFVERE